MIILVYNYLHIHGKKRKARNGMIIPIDKKNIRWVAQPTSRFSCGNLL